jgi:hypothetical protein
MYRCTGFGDVSTITAVAASPAAATPTSVIQLALMTPGTLACLAAPSVCSSIINATGGNPANGQMVIGGVIWAAALYFLFGSGGGRRGR